MIAARLTLKGLSETRAAIRSKGEEAERRLGQILVEALLRVEGVAKTLAPVDTGFLRANIRAEVESVLRDMAGRVVAGATYSAFVEFGTSRMRAQPFLVPALESVAPWLFEQVRALRDEVAQW